MLIAATAIICLAVGFIAGLTTGYSEVDNLCPPDCDHFKEENDTYDLAGCD